MATKKTTPEPLPKVVYAQASPKSIGGSSLFDATRSIDHRNVEAYMSEEPVVRDAVARLQAAGFQVLQVSPTTINIAGPPSLYQKYFSTRLVTDQRRVIKPQVGETTATFVDTPDTDMPGLIDTSQSAAADVLEGVAIEEPVYLHQSALPPTRSYWHLNVPGDVSLGMNADKAHRMQVTGLGVKVVMVDSGWFRHPYFAGRGYRSAPVVLGPGATKPADDESGHGTGESANLFAIAPDIDFTMVKFSNVNSTAAFNAAVGLRPHVISCSWGFDIRTSQLSAANTALAAAVAAAVASGIIVVFSAGNGHFGFPGQHPDVIAAGGVFVEPDMSLHASDYASGFASPVYPGRNVPDVSGLVGMQPGAAYIMLPVQPGDEIDKGRGNGKKHPNGDETANNDGWAAFSGTSAAAPQVAGICALIRQAAPGLTPAQVKDILNRTARDVTTGQNQQGDAAGPGYDLATGHGLADAQRAVLAARLTSLPVNPPVPLPIPPVLPVPVPPLPRPPLPGPIPPGPVDGVSIEDAATLSAYLADHE
jgi:subtilisin family serine protease